MSVRGTLLDHRVPRRQGRRVWGTVAALAVVAVTAAVPLEAQAPPVVSATTADAEVAPLKPFRHFTRRETPGLPQNSISALALDSEGVLYLGTLDGLALYDGLDMVDLGDIAGTPAFGSVTTVVPRSQGGVYVGGATGLLELKGPRDWVSLGNTHGIASIAEGSPGVLWTVDPQGRVNRITQGTVSTWQQVPLPEGVGMALSVAKGMSGTVWLRTQRAVLRVERSGVPVVAGHAPGGRTLTTLWVDRAGHPWLGASDGTIVRFLPPVGFETPQQSCEPGVTVTALVDDWRGRIWAGCADGQLSVGAQPAGPRTLWGTKDGLQVGLRITALATDRQGHLWIGQNAVGATQLVSERWRHRTHWTGTERRIPGETVFGIWPRPGGGFLSAVFARGVWRWDERHVEEIGKSSGLTEDVRYAVEPSPGVLWAGGRFGLYESARGGRFQRVLSLPTGFVNLIAQSPAGTWYALTSTAGLWRYDGRRWAPERAINTKLPHQNARGISWFRNGEMWVATAAGIAVVSSGRVTVVDAKVDGRPFLTNSVLELPGGDVWAGGLGGLLIRHDGVWRHVTHRDGLPGRSIYALALGTDGSVWVGGSSGVGRFRNGRWEVFDRTSGMIEDECTLGGMLPLPDGRVVVGTMGSLAVFDPRVQAPPIEPLRLFWRHTLRAGPDGIARLPVGQRSVHLRWSAPWLSPTPIQYRARVLPDPGEYYGPMERPELDIPRLSPGRFTVEVQARTGGPSPGPWTQPLTLTVEVAPHLHETWWARLLSVLLLLGLVPLGIKARTRALERREQELKRAVDAALAAVKTITGLIPICASCKRIRDDLGSWSLLEEYLNRHSDATLSHGICPECLRKLYPDLASAVEGRTTTDDTVRP